MSENIGYQSPAVYLPQASVLLQQPIRDRLENLEPTQKIEVDRTAELPEGLRVSEPGASGENFSGSGFSTDHDAKDQPPPPGNKVMAQEIVSRANENEQRLDDKKSISAVPSPSEIVGSPEALTRLDQDRDGHIDQLEVKHAIRAENDSTTYAALSQYRKALNLSTTNSDEQVDTKKMFDDAEGGKKLFDDVGENKKLFDETAEEQKLYDDADLEKKLYDEVEAEEKMFDEQDEDALRRKIYGEEAGSEGEPSNGSGQDEDDDGVTEVVV